MNGLDNGTKTVTKNIIHMRKYMHGRRLLTLEQSVYHICISFVQHLKDKLNDSFNSHIFTITAIYDISRNKPL